MARIIRDVFLIFHLSCLFRFKMYPDCSFSSMWSINSAFLWYFANIYAKRDSTRRFQLASIPPNQLRLLRNRKGECLQKRIQIIQFTHNLPMFRFQCCYVCSFIYVLNNVISISRSYSLIFLYFYRFINVLSYDLTDTF